MTYKQNERQKCEKAFKVQLVIKVENLFENAQPNVFAAFQSIGFNFKVRVTLKEKGFSLRLFMERQT